MDKLDMNKRVLLATALALVFFIVYDYFVIPKPTQKVETNISNTQAPTVEQSTNINQAPTMTTSQENIIAKVESEHFDIEIDRFGRVSQYYLKDKKFQNETNSKLALFDTSLSPKPLEIRYSDSEINSEAFKTNYVASSEFIKLEDKATLTLTQTLSNLTVTKELTFYKNGSYDIKLTFDKPIHYFLSTGYRPNVVADEMTFKGALIKEADGSVTMIEDGDAQNQTMIGAKIASVMDRYYTSALYNLNGNLKVVIQNLNSNPALFIESDNSINLSGFIGAKDYRLLQSINDELTPIVEYGFFTFISKPIFAVLLFFYELVGNWGWAIVLLTISIRIVLYPLTYKGMVSMNKLKELAPKMKEIQEKYKGDHQKMQTHLMDLYRKHDANPMGGCLPLILQIPVFFAIYRVLLNAIELQGAEWILWINDLSVMDEFFVLPLLMGLTMFIQQKITPSNFTDPIQEKVFRYLPVVFTIFFVMFPAGLVLYWLVNNIFSIGQQHFINKMFENRKLSKNIVSQEVKNVKK